MEGYFRIVTTVYNAEEFIGDCIKSVLAQTDEKWHQIVVVDGATDNTLEEAKKAAGDDPRIKIVEVPKRKGICNSHQLAHNTHYREEDDVFIHLDGDDIFLYKESLEYIRSVYTKHDVWATYGSYVAKSGNACVAHSVDLEKNIRSHIKTGWPFSHPRTFRCFLWDKLTSEDFRDKEGKEYTAAVDVAIFAPVLEMCGHRIAYIEDPLYLYNDDTELNEHKVALGDQARCALDICSRKARLPL
tara:strand:+ start:4034 stop:4762 length:729 start_codon:yes stop_codon:yes gene_type:complete